MNRSERRIASLPTDVYRVYDDSGALLYVGIVRDAIERLRDHRRYSAWWQHATEGTISRYANRLQAIAVESYAISTESPLYNVTRGFTLNKPPAFSPVAFITLYWESGEVSIDAA